MAKCPPGEIRDELQQRVESQQAPIDAKLAEEIILPKESVIIKALRKIGEIPLSPREVTPEQWDSMYGPE